MTSPAVPLSPAERRVLKGRAHALHPVVIVGSRGLTESALREAEVALKSHELIKIKLASDDREVRANQFAALAAALAASPVQQIGKIGILYRKRLEAPAAAPLPKARRPASAARARAPSRPRPAAARPDPTRFGTKSAARSRRGAARPSPARKPVARP